MHTKIYIIILFLLPLSLLARPVSYPGGYTVIQDNDYIANSIWAHYSPTAHDSIGARIDYLRENKAKLYTAQYTRLVKRWNQEDSQSNIYFMGGLGSASYKANDELVAWAGISTDWETRRWYLAYKNRYTYINTVAKMFHNRGRIGYAPYKVGYKDIQPWVMLQLEKVNFIRLSGQDDISKKSEKIVVTPMLRFFKGRYLVEFGASSEKTLMFNWIIRY